MSFETYSTVTQEVIDVEEVNLAYKIGSFTSPNGVQKGYSQEEFKMVDRLDNKIKTIIYNDGKITKLEEVAPITINEYYINKKKYAGEVNQLVKKKLYVENSTYIVKVLVADEVLKYRNGIGHFDVIKDVKILLKDKKDKEAKKKAEDTLKSISRDSRNYKSVWDVVLGRKPNSKDLLEYENVTNNVYRLKKRKQTSNWKDRYKT